MKPKLTILAVLMMTLAMPQVVRAYDFYANSPSGHRVYYSIIDYGSNQNTLKVDTYPNSYSISGELIIPDSVMHGGIKMPVTEIENGVFQNKTNLLSVVIPTTVNRIGNNAFAGCNNLRRITFNNPNLSYVGEDAFYYSNYNSTYTGHVVDTVSIVGSILDWCNTTYFYNESSNPLFHCNNLVIDGEKIDNLIVPEGVQRLMWGCFVGAPIKKVTLPTSLKYVGSVCFDNCGFLEEIVIPDAVTFIGGSCFSECRNLRKVTFGVALDSVNAGLFLNCIALDTVIFRGGIPSYIAVTETQHLFWIKTGQGISLNDTINPTIIVPCGQLEAFSNSVPLTTVYSCNEYGSYHSVHNSVTDIQELFYYKANAISSDTALGVVSILQEPSCTNANLIIQATPSPRCRLYQWSDGCVDEYRILSVSQDTFLMATFAIVDTLILTNQVHDTTIVIDTVTIVEYVPVHDTTTVTDTVTLTEFVPVHDTAYINVYDTTYINVLVHDTTVVTDTVTLTEYVPVHDTTYIDVHETTYVNVPVHDTTVVIDTVTLTEYVPVHDTTYIDVHDTTYINVPVHDTTVMTDTVTLTEYVPVHDTTYIDVHDTTYINVLVHDTTIVTDTVTQTEYVPVHDTAYIDIHDTTYINVPVHDTTIITDTVTLTEYVPVHDTTYITLTDTLTLIQYDTITNTLFDTIDNFIYDTLMVTDTLWLTQTDTLWLHDTIIIHDTVYITDEGVGGVDALNAKVYSSHGQIVVEGADDNTVILFDINGRMMATKQDYGTAICFDVPASGTYLIKIGNHAVHKVVVIR